ncbi:ComEC/Rec2 family competence protein [Bacillus massiliglaciei]|uniref:ComEC/Rec2 family competence protein n=1 Tax=Bacillus massiliglaciei TaxID=1816693 RepID=UPI000B0BCEC1|nr:ComEC/Rec2 family competence protein [Bacillus massiliglaciei]
MKKLQLLIVIVLFFTLSGGITKADAGSRLTVHFIDIGQGDSALIQTSSGENYLIDGGEREKSQQIIAYLKKLKVKTIDSVILTHPDGDHVGGLAAVIQTFRVNNIYASKVAHATVSYKNFLKAVQKKGLKIKKAENGVVIKTKAKKTSLSFLAPVKSYDKKDLNNWSAVLLLKHHQKKFLFTGDIEKEAEKDLIERGLIPKVDVLKVAHHGSHTSTTASFLKKAKPKFAVISLGDNDYGHPTPEVLRLLKACKSQIFRTDQDGTVVFHSSGWRLTAETEKQLQPPAIMGVNP